jgi:hypothetical protein
MKLLPCLASFNQMVSRQEEYTRRLEEQTLEPERADGQAPDRLPDRRRSAYTLKEMGLFGKKLRDALLCPHLLP